MGVYNSDNSYNSNLNGIGLCPAVDNSNYFSINIVVRHRCASYVLLVYYFTIAAMTKSASASDNMLGGVVTDMRRSCSKRRFCGIFLFGYHFLLLHQPDMEIDSLRHVVLVSRRTCWCETIEPSVRSTSCGNRCVQGGDVATNMPLFYSGNIPKKVRVARFT